MPITAKELAQKLNLSTAAVSMALNNKPGVSTATRRLVLDIAKKYGYDFSRISEKQAVSGCIYFVNYKKHGAVVADTPFFSEVTDGISLQCQKSGYKLKSCYIYKDEETIQRQIEEIQFSDCIGILLLGTEMSGEDLAPFTNLQIPLVLLDTYFDTAACDCILINNVQGAFLATSYLICKTKAQPGYLQSAYPIRNFSKRSVGFYQAVRDHGMSPSKSIVHSLTPSVEGSYADMIRLIEQGEELASCYFADNDLIAVGVMKAFKEKGYQIPADISIIGFDNLPISSIIEPALTTVHVPKQYMGELAVDRLIKILNEPNSYPVKTELSTTLVKRKSILR